MTLTDLERCNAANYPYQKERADTLQRLLVALLLSNGPARITAAGRAAAQGPLSDYELISNEDVVCGDLRLMAVRR